MTQLIETKNDAELVAAVKAQWKDEIERLQDRIARLEKRVCEEKEKLAVLKARAAK